MRAREFIKESKSKEFVINVPINIKINGDDEPEIELDVESEDEESEEKVFIPPLQQEIELQKASNGKSSKVIRDLLQNESRIYRVKK